MPVSSQEWWHNSLATFVGSLLLPGSQLPPRRASVPPCLHSILQAQTFCGSKPGGSLSLAFQDIQEKTIGDWGGEGTLDPARLGGQMEQ